MPFTPFHLGPGLLIKGGFPAMSLCAFGIAQIVIDVESLYFMVRELWPLHRFMHTLAGVTLAALLSMGLAWKLTNPVLRWWNRHLSPGQLRWFQVDETVTFSGVVAGSVAGAYSHLLLDMIMHLDVGLWGPQSLPGLYGLMNVYTLYWSCLLTGVVGSMIVAIRCWRR